MTDTKALDALIEAVERGLPSPTNWRNFSAVPTGAEDNPGPILAHRAYHGSLDAAKALHEALLPGWGWETGINATFASIASVWRSGRERAYGATSEIPARAWLLCQLKAHRASL